jgi:hypothetical protein
MPIIEFSLLAAALMFAAYLCFRSILKSETPLSERVCLAMLRFAAWLENVGTAYDAAILRYRMERRLVCIEMASTAERQYAAAAPLKVERC